MDVNSLFGGEFRGSVVDLSKTQRYRQIRTIAEELNEESMEVVSVSFSNVSIAKQNAIVVVEFRRGATLYGNEKESFIVMSMLADSLFVTSSPGIIRVSFGVENICS